jgi:hypothetical protein
MSVFRNGAKKKEKAGFGFTLLPKKESKGFIFVFDD